MQGKITFQMVKKMEEGGDAGFGGINKGDLTWKQVSRWIKNMGGTEKEVDIMNILSRKIQYNQYFICFSLHNKCYRTL